MRPFDPTSVLPEFAAEQASGSADEQQLAELLADLANVTTSTSSVLASEVASGRARLLAAVSGRADRFAPFFEKLSRFFDLSVEKVQAVLERAERESEWQPGPLPWVSLFHLEGGAAIAGLDAGFVRLKKGMPFPRHRHGGSERVLVLQGGYYDHEQRFYGPGDAHDMVEGSEHALQMVSDEDVLLAVILSAEIEVVGAR